MLELKNNKEKYLDNLHKVIDIIIQYHRHNILSSILHFLNLIDDKEYIDKMNEVIIHNEYKNDFCMGENNLKLV